MWKKNYKIYIVLGIVLLLYGSCSQSGKKRKDGKLRVVTTTTMLTDLLQKIGGEAIRVEGLMGSGVDPHLYKASEGDVSKLFDADVIFYNGLHLEGKLEEVFEKMKQQDKSTIAVSEALDPSQLIRSENFASNYDPHIWFDVENWKKVTQYVAEKLTEIDSANALSYQENAEDYLGRLDALQNQVVSINKSLPKQQRILVTAHDAFNYFGKAYDFEVVGLQGISTATEAGVQDVQRLADFIVQHKVRAIFVESSIPRRTVEALQAAVEAKGEKVAIGGTLYSDALGSPRSDEGTYIGMFTYNVKTIVKALR